MYQYNTALNITTKTADGVVSWPSLSTILLSLQRCSAPLSPLPEAILQLKTVAELMECWGCPGIRRLVSEEGGQSGGSPKGGVQDEEVWPDQQRRLHRLGVHTFCDPWQRSERLYRLLSPSILMQSLGGVALCSSCCQWCTSGRAQFHGLEFFEVFLLTKVPPALIASFVAWSAGVRVSCSVWCCPWPGRHLLRHSARHCRRREGGVSLAAAEHANSCSICYSWMLTQHARNTIRALHTKYGLHLGH